MDRLAKYAAAGLFLIFCAALAPWAHDFPLNDDWAYALAARALAETGRLALSDWGSATQLPHVALGALSAKVFGFSFAALRVANLLVAAAAVFVFVRLLEEFGIAPFERLAAGLALALNPLYLVLANSFMTDIHYLFWMLAACLFYVRNIKNPADARALWLAGACAAAAYLTRQLAVALPLAFTAALLQQRRLKLRELGAAWALPLAAMAGHYLWFKFSHGPTWASENYVGASTLAHLAKPAAFLNDSVFRLFSSMTEIGLLLLPLAGGALKPSGFFASPLFWKAATAAAALSSVFLLCCSSLALRAGGQPLRFLFLAGVLQLGVSLIGAKFFDRYLLTLLPWFAAAAVYTARGVKFSRPALGLALAVYAIIGWAGMADYLAWNRAKWELASRPRPGLAQGEIAAGFDHDAWLNYPANMAYLRSMKPLKMIGEWEWQKINKYKAIISYAPDPRLRQLDKTEYATPLSRGKVTLYLLSLQPR